MSCVFRKLQEFDGLMTGVAAVGVQGEEQRGKEDQVLMDQDSEMCFPSFLNCFLSDSL